ncbi:MAG: long-chain fatty acid--CoA ligase [Pyrinomonadaceae bacterium]|nr:long-chain fatty acid--CoA ligase [Phycisphaerales bacterium]
MHSRSAWLDALTRHAAERPGAAAVAEVSVDGEITRTETWQEFLWNVDARASELGHVAQPGETVLAAWGSGIDLAAWFAGAVAAGVRLVLMHPRCGARECAAVCAKADVRAVLAAESLLARIPETVARVGDLSHGAALQRRGNNTEGHMPGSIVLGSSGTTGLPKLVLRESAALDADAAGVAGGLSLTSGDCVLCVPPLCHSYGVDMLLGTLFAGATLRVMPAFDPVGVARQLTGGVTVLPGLPFVYESLARLWGVDGDVDRASPSPSCPPHTLRLAVSAGSSLSARVRREFTDTWKIEIGQLYGATELGTVSLSIPGEAGFDGESIGLPLPGVSFRVVDVDDPARLVAPGEEGQLAVRAPSMLTGYLDDALSLVDGHLLTGDLARLDRSGGGRVTITGRIKLLIDTGGFKVNPLEVEGALLEHPDVAECAVVPMVLSDTIQRLSMLVVPRDAGRPPVDSELRQFLRERLAPVKVPRSFEIVGSLPRSPLGKLLRDQLAKRSV